MTRLQNKHAIITGAASGIGRAAAHAFAKSGASLVLGDLSPLDDLVAEITEQGGTAVALQGDVSDEAYAKALVARCKEQFGSVHVFFANAGTGGQPLPILEETKEAWEQVLAVNLVAPFLAVRHAAPEIIEAGGGSIILTASVAGLRSGAGPAAYSASKAGVVSLAQTAASQLATQGVRVNAICPGFIETGMTAPIFEYARAAGKGDRLGNKCPMQRPGQPDEIAQVAVHLASDESSYVTGQAIAVDGGLCATHPFTPGRWI